MTSYIYNLMIKNYKKNKHTIYCYQPYIINKLRMRQFSARFDSYRTRSRKECEQNCLCVMIIISIPLFFGLLFGFLWPEIYRSGFIKTSCSVTSVDVIERYGCFKSCGCTESSLNVDTCDNIINKDQQINPETCVTNNTDYTYSTEPCPIENENCNNGYYCCRTVCVTYPCGKSTCTSCHCATRVNNNLCTINCQILYSGALYVEYDIIGGNEHKKLNSSYVQDFQLDIENAQKFIDYYDNKHSFTCYYNPENTTEIVLSNGYTAWKIVIFVIFGILPFTFCIFLLIRVILHCYNITLMDFCCLKKRIPVAEPVRIAKSIPETTIEMT